MNTLPPPPLSRSGINNQAKRDLDYRIKTLQDSQERWFALDIEQIKTLARKADSPTLLRNVLGVIQKLGSFDSDRHVAYEAEGQQIIIAMRD